MGISRYSGISRYPRTEDQRLDQLLWTFSHLRVATGLQDTEYSFIVEISTKFSHHDVNEAAAIALPHELKGNAIHSFVILRAGAEPGKELENEIREHVSKEIGPIAKPETVTFVDTLPKTRSGKIMRRVLKARALGQDEGDLTTLEE